MTEMKNGDTLQFDEKKKKLLPFLKAYSNIILKSHSNTVERVMIKGQNLSKKILFFLIIFF